MSQKWNRYIYTTKATIEIIAVSQEDADEKREKIESKCPNEVDLDFAELDDVIYNVGPE